MSGFDSTPTTSATRPLITAGPMERAFRPARSVGSIGAAASGAAARARASREIRRMLPPRRKNVRRDRIASAALISRGIDGCQSEAPLTCDILPSRRPAMRLHVLGSSGGYPVPDNPCTGFLLEQGETRIWMDAGNGTMAAVQRIVPLEQIDALVISHVHADH